MVHQVTFTIAAIIVFTHFQSSYTADCPEYARKSVTIESEEISEDDWDYQQQYQKAIYVKGGRIKGKRIFPPQQQIIQQQSNSIPIFQSNINNVPNIGLNNIPNVLEENNVDEDVATTPAPEKIILWHLKVHAGAKEVSLVELDGEKKPKAFIFGGAEIKNKSKAYSISQIQIDIRSADPKSGQWYLVCVKQNIIYGSKMSECTQCSMVKADESYSNEPISTKLVRVTPTQAKVTYDVTDYPLVTSFIRTTAVPVRDLKRCNDKLRKTVVVESKILPNTITEVTLGSLDQSEQYVIVSQLVINAGSYYRALGLPVNTTVANDVIDNAAISIPRACEETSSFGERSLPDGFEIELEN